MKRLIDYYLQTWKQEPARQPLLLRGARQVGKTYAAQKLGASFPHFVEINLELQPQAKVIFEPDLVPERIITQLSAFTGKPIIPGKTLLFTDS